MAAFVLPVTSAQPDYTFQCELDGTTYQFHFRWNEGDLGFTPGWYMDILDVSGNELVNSVRVVVGFPLAARSRYNPGMPPGSFIASDTSGQDQDPGVDDLGNRVQILYYSVVEDGQ